MKTSCGAVLIATQFTETVEWSTGASGSSAESVSGAAASAVAALAATKAGVAPTPKIFDEQYAFVDENKRALYEMPYTVKLPSGEFFHGVTDLEGRTERFATDGSQLLEVYIGHRSS